jgi:DNA-binding transcriptional LysR family regulator
MRVNMGSLVASDNRAKVPFSSDSRVRNRNDENLGSLHAFVFAAEAHSFTRAGQRLGISSSAVGKAIARLEARLGVRLLHRSTRTVTLTPEGALFLERCRRILAEVEAAESEITHTQSAPGGKLRVSMPLIGVLMMPARSGAARKHRAVSRTLSRGI